MYFVILDQQIKKKNYAKRFDQNHNIETQLEDSEKHGGVREVLPLKQQ